MDNLPESYFPETTDKPLIAPFYKEAREFFFSCLPPFYRKIYESKKELIYELVDYRSDLFSYKDIRMLFHKDIMRRLVVLLHILGCLGMEEKMRDIRSKAIEYSGVRDIYHYMDMDIECVLEQLVSSGMDIPDVPKMEETYFLDEFASTPIGERILARYMLMEDQVVPSEVVVVDVSNDRLAFMGEKRGMKASKVARMIKSGEGKVKVFNSTRKVDYVTISGKYLVFLLVTSALGVAVPLYTDDDDINFVTSV
ncbi:hypothetical protein [Hydrogenivirga caldilitoris]|uniref:hypothetical protein n=1 Tax=Hydrogenivirga caldilitoris TaxID=246264 RepID=UPI0011C483C1|nr:hypothetical protein [Hydrogenivirga caldilitoris]